ncbi:hypothetical protein Z517_00353 [Fonsecaea pedrosoi CBS 271.37]|uniref:Unplaced genomic scaffold supercont1.1, whole genome shotgun sequence n=1 Tax=Fonsecaea pedrosoi CBS 271.37 TaxID=1442368 RepID=A0A0D2H276_9EURO|nr:uncharacterized protein Z517_00353 [Fonsecaea pedrosoi CBS 271.37]KIW84965.1 hypothetical protein Z517_00353 [Fonsecaea pedrosoi CBS 271.37]
MRLRLLIQRYSLPPVTIIHTTGSGPASHTKSRSATIADLLADVNDLVPLESADGEWGLEDYVVEVSATADQHLTYECLHYQTLHSVLREDDEVVIRALSNDDLRARRLGGRHQITGDGRHLIDGVAFGKQWLRKTARPGVLIPPRKRRRILFDEDTDGPAGEDTGLILPAADEEEAYTNALVPFTSGEEEDDDDEDDDDYVEDEANADVDNSQLQVTIREEFDDADADAEDEADLDGGDEDERLSSELKHLLEDAAEIEQAGNMAIALQVLDKRLKRKRDVGDDGEEYENETFEGFSTPIHSSPAKVYGKSNGRQEGRAELKDDRDGGLENLIGEIADRQDQKSARDIMVWDDDDEYDSEDSDMTSSSGITSSDTDTDSDADSMMEDIALQQSKKRVLNLVRGLEVDNKSTGLDPEEVESESDSSSTSDSESESSDDTSSEATTSSDSQSDSESDSESDAEEAKAESPLVSKTAPPTAAIQTRESPEKPAKPLVGVPFQGTHKTHYNNARVKRRRRLNELKRQGALPENAGFEELARYETMEQQTVEEEQLSGVKQPADPPVQEDAPDAESRTDATVKSAEKEGDENLKSSDYADSAVTNDALTASVSAELKAIETSQTEPPIAPESTPKRARLDLASTRRLVFGSLGLRAPKNAKEDQALRVKLSQNIRQPKQQEGHHENSVSEFSQRSPVEGTDDDFWKNRLIVSAVECEEPGAFLPPPPFPFEQGWAKPDRNKRKLRDQSQYYQSRNDRSRGKDKGSFAPVVSTLEYDDVSADTSSTHAVPTLDGNSDIPAQEDLDSLPELEQAMVLPGATIAYKELHVDASTNYQPEVSHYRIGQVTQVDEDGTVHLHLMNGSRAADSKGKVDPRTGERVYGKFELASEDADTGADDGLREISLADMISAKLFKPSTIEVPDSNHASGSRGSEAPLSSSENQFVNIPESAEQDVQLNEAEKQSSAIDTIDTPRKQEINGIIKEAGFNSALDENLLRPIPDVAAGDVKAPSVPIEEEAQPQGQYPHRFRPRSPGLDLPLPGMNTSSDVDPSTTHNEGSGDAGATGSSQLPPTSSPLIPTQETVDYPHISQMDIHSSESMGNTNSSSHQDAQKDSLAPSIDLSSASDPKTSSNEMSSGKKGELGAEGLGNENHSHSEGEPNSLESEIPESQSQKTSMPSQNMTADGEEIGDRSSFLGELGYDGHDSSYHDSGNSDDDSDLPSLSELLSTQRNRRRTRSLTKRVSPPAPARKSLRNATKMAGKSPTPQGSPDLSARHRANTKVSQSQSKSRLSQVSSGSPVVDLTFSSDPQSPLTDDSDLLYSQKKIKSEVNNLNRGTSARTGKQDSGIGSRRLLTTKKVREYY